MNLEQLSTEQLNAYFRETKWILKQISWITPGLTQSPEAHALASSVENQTIAIQDAIRAERARRALVHLQTQLAAE